MLPARHRVRTPDEFRRVMRSGVRSGGRLLVLHVAPPSPGGPTPTRVGFVVPRSVGTAVVRNQVRRRLRHLVSARLLGMPKGIDLVVRVLPGAAAANGRELGEALDRGLRKVVLP